MLKSAAPSCHLSRHPSQFRLFRCEAPQGPHSEAMAKLPGPTSCGTCTLHHHYRHANTVTTLVDLKTHLTLKILKHTRTCWTDICYQHFWRLETVSQNQAPILSPECPQVHGRE
ncbi:hypothetical protein O3P69_004072 [Scylla paramamosain]|uniref:Uncharacterized protein n=1 Tax=Scylla paramamosain TaxID=85552 RepID=A0AAW0UHF4_SCYPA